MEKVLVQGFKKSKKLRSELFAAAESIQREFPKANISVTLRPESKKKDEFRLSFLVRIFQHEILLTRRDGRLYPMIHEAKHDVIDKIHRLKDRIFNHKNLTTPKEAL